MGWSHKEIAGQTSSPAMNCKKGWRGRGDGGDVRKKRGEEEGDSSRLLRHTQKCLSFFSFAFLLFGERW
jgi:hypothetical protein